MTNLSHRLLLGFFLFLIDIGYLIIFWICPSRTFIKYQDLFLGLDIPAISALDVHEKIPLWCFKDHNEQPLEASCGFFSFPDVYNVSGHLFFLEICPFRMSLLGTGLLFILI